MSVRVTGLDLGGLSLIQRRWVWVWVWKTLAVAVSKLVGW